MTAATETCPIDSEYAPDPCEVLDRTKKSEIAVAIKAGASRRMAAEIAGCHHATIARTAERDPAFAKQLSEAESGVDFAALKRIQEASAENKNWRAAAWVLERRHPEEFGRRTPHKFTGDQVMGLLAQIFDFTLPTVRKNKVNAFMREFNEAMREVEGQVRRADHWRNMAEADRGNPRRYGKPLRSPYEHSGWFDPNRRETPPEDDIAAFSAWLLQKLPDDTFDWLQKEYQAKTGRPSNVKKPASESSEEEESLEEADEEAEDAGGTTSEPQTEDELCGEPESSASGDAQHPATEIPAKAGTPTELAAVDKNPSPAGEPVAAEQQSVVEVDWNERTCAPRPAAAAPSPAAPPAAPLPPITPFPMMPTPDGKPPTEEAHQAYRQYMEWLHGAAARKLVDINSLQQQALRARPVAVPVGGAQMGWQIRSSSRR